MRIMICALASGLSLSACQPGPKPDGDAVQRQSNAVTTQSVIRGEAALPATRSPWDEAKARGVAFRGIGNEPGWIVEVDQGGAPALRATLDYGERTLEAARMQPLAGAPGFTGKTTNGTAVVLRIQRGACSDGMSDERYPASVELMIGEQRYMGCGRFLVELP